MPELPELEVLRVNLARQIGGKRLQRFLIRKPYIQKTTLPDDLEGQNITGITRRGKYIVIDAERNRFIIHLMFRGRLKWMSPDAEIMKSAAAVMTFPEGTIQLVEDAKLKRMSLWIIGANVEADHLRRLGPEPLTPEFTKDRLASIISTSHERLKGFLVNQRNVAGIGNAYSDEICWDAGLSPFKQSNKLTPQEITRLYNSIGKVLREGIFQTRKVAGDSLDIPEKREFMNVHRHKDEPCPRCGTTIAWVSTSSRNTYYCPGCQTGGKVLKDGRTSKFLR
ncbi:Fpg/Nei family DNA glycosylase [candidate division WOR-3 bacterium]|nr:Fpg/Nei family DNA glycosylase [candidate division WOR-3 bacterium]